MYLNALPHGLFDDVNVVVVEAQVPHTVLDETSPPAQNVWLVRLEDLSHESLGHLVSGLGQPLLDSLAKVGHVARPEPTVKVRVTSDKSTRLGPINQECLVMVYKVTSVAL